MFDNTSSLPHLKGSASLKSCKHFLKRDVYLSTPAVYPLIKPILTMMKTIITSQIPVIFASAAFTANIPDPPSRNPRDSGP